MRYHPVTIEESTLCAHFVGPDGMPTDHTVVRRVCPITRASVRITPKRPLDAGIGAPLPDLSEPIRATARCPFCAPDVFSKTPTFPLSLTPTPRLQKGHSILFPNLAPYGRNSAVLLLSLDHHIPMGRFPHSLYLDGLLNLAHYIRLVKQADPSSSQVAITQNILPSSGGAMFHPHMQINLDVEPMGYQSALLASQRAWQTTHHDANLLLSWARQECSGPRHVATKGVWQLAAAFAPTAQEEFHLFFAEEQPHSLADLQEKDWSDFAALVVLVQQFWQRRGFNSGHVTLFGSVTGQLPPMGRIMLRSTYSPWYRSDQSCYEVGCWEPSRDVSPEALADMARMHFRTASPTE